MAISQLLFQALYPKKVSFTIFQNAKTRFQAIKTRSSKRRKIDIFPKVLTHGFGLKMAIFQTSFSQVIQARKISFTIFQSEKMPFQTIKTRSSESQKSDIFPNGLTDGFGPKMAIFPTFFCRQYRPSKCVLRYSRKKKTPFQAIKTRSSKSRKVDIFPEGLTHGFGPKMANFLTCSFQAKQDRKMSFLGCKNKKFKNLKN